MQITLELLIAAVTLLSLWNSVAWFFVTREIKLLQLNREKASLELEHRILSQRTSDLLRLAEDRQGEIDSWREALDNFKSWIENHYAGYKDLEDLVRRVTEIEGRLRNCATCPK